MPDNSPVISPQEVALLVKEGGLSFQEVLSKLTKEEKRAILKSGLLNDPEIVQVYGDSISPIGTIALAAKQLPKLLKQVGKPMGPLQGKAAPELAAKKVGLGRVPTEGGGVVDKAGLPATIKVKSKGHPPQATPDPPNLQRMGNTSFTETEKRANMFGGAKVEGQAVKPNARQPISMKPTEELSEAEKLIQEIMKGKTGGSLPNNARRGAVLKSPKKK